MQFVYRCLIVGLCLQFPGQIEAQPITEWERVLLAIAAEPTPGAHGSHWVSELSVYNDSTEPVPFAPVRVTEGYTLRPKSTLSPPIFLNPAGKAPGAVVRVPAAVASAVSFNLRVRDISRDADDWGTEIPVVRESSLQSDSIQLFEIPIDDRFRQTLRIYSIGELETTGGAVVVRAFALPSDVLLMERTLQLAVDGFTAATPGYAEVSALREMFEVPEHIQSLRIEIDRLTPGGKIWAFVSMTNNQTQRVTLVTPQ